MKVTINTHGHSVEIETTEDGMTTRDLASLATAVWHTTAGTSADQPGPAVGFTRELQPARHGRASLRHGERPDVR